MTVNDEVLDQAFELLVVEGKVGSGAEWTQDYEQLLIYEGSGIDLTVHILDQDGVPRSTGGDRLVFRTRPHGSLLVQ